MDTLTSTVLFFTLSFWALIYVVQLVYNFYPTSEKTIVTKKQFWLMLIPYIPCYEI